MENPNFTFVIGDPADDATGRSVQGQVYFENDSWRFEADLVRRWSPQRYQFNRVALTVDRPFDIIEFCMLYRMVSSGRFVTNIGSGKISAANEADLPLVKNFGQNVPEKAADLSDLFVEDVARMEEQLDQLRKREMLQMAFATRQAGDGITIHLDG